MVYTAGFSLLFAESESPQRLGCGYFTEAATLWNSELEKILHTLFCLENHRLYLNYGMRTETT